MPGLEVGGRTETRSVPAMSGPDRLFRLGSVGDAVHGSLITVKLGGIATADRAPPAQQVRARLDLLVMRHEVVWGLGASGLGAR